MGPRGGALLSASVLRQGHNLAEFFGVLGDGISCTGFLNCSNKLACIGSIFIAEGVLCGSTWTRWQRRA